MNLTLCAVLTCTDEPYITEPLLLCQQHAVMVSINVTDVLYATARMTAAPAAGLDVERASLAPITVWDQPSHTPVVYFLTNGDRVKIGTSTNITARVSALALRKANAALVLRGGNNLEAALHKHFATDRIGNTEWFVLSPRLQSYITRMRGSSAPLQQPHVPQNPTAKAIIPTPRKQYGDHPQSASDKILEALKAFSNPSQTSYLHKDQISDLIDVRGSTLNNRLTELVKTGRIHRQPGTGRAAQGMYGYGPAPTDGDE